MTAVAAERRTRLRETRTWSGYRSAHFARSTGTLVVVYDQHDGWVDPTAESERWATLCDDHGALATHPSLGLALRHATCPEDWCDECRDAV